MIRERRMEPCHCVVCNDCWRYACDLHCAFGGPFSGYINISGSSNGRTSPFDGDNLGSTPSPESSK